MSDTPQRTAVYRFFDADDVLLYVGLTNNPPIRWASHARKKAWWSRVARKTTDWYASRSEAAEVEATAILVEKPRWNVAIPKEGGGMRYSAASLPIGRPATGRTPSHTFRVPNDVWKPAEARVGEGHMAALITRLLERDNAAAARRQKKAAVEVGNQPEG